MVSRSIYKCWTKRSDWFTLSNLLISEKEFCIDNCLVLKNLQEILEESKPVVIITWSVFFTSLAPVTESKLTLQGNSYILALYCAFRPDKCTFVFWQLKI